MTKADIINEIVDRTGMARRDVSVTVEALMQVIKEKMVDERENVYLRGFGSFIVKERATKTARNISKDTAIIIPAHNIPAFKPAKTFMAQVSGELVNEEAE